MDVQKKSDSGANVSIILQPENPKQVIKKTVGSLKTPTQEPPPEQFTTRKEALTNSSSLRCCECGNRVSFSPVDERDIEVCSYDTAKKMKDLHLVAALTGHKEGSRAFARYRAIDEEMKKEINVLN